VVQRDRATEPQARAATEHGAAPTSSACSSTTITLPLSSGAAGFTTAAGAVPTLAELRAGAAAGRARAAFAPPGTSPGRVCH
jgi:hypothetical protein